MKVCAEYEDQVTAMTAHKRLVDDGIDPEDIEIRSPYPLSEAPLPPHRSTPMNMRFVVRCMWAVAVTLGFSFVTYTQYEWAPVTATGSHPLIAPPITMIVTYECGMITAIWTTTFMFFLETFRYRKLVPPLEEDMPVAIGYICLVVAKRSQERAMALLEGTGARSIVTYLMVLLLGFMSLTSSGCARYNMREQDVVKSTEARSEYPPANSVRMMPEADAKYAAPAAMAAVHFGDTDTYTKMRALEQQKMRLGRDKDAFAKAGKTAEADAADKKRTEVVAQVTAMQAQMKTLGTEPSLSALKNIGAPPPSMKDWKNPYAGDKASVARGEQLYLTNCAACHGKTGLGDGKVGEVTYVEPPKIGSGKTYGKLDDGYLYYYIYTGKNLMPSFGYRLPNQEICDIVNHLRELQKVNP